MGNKTIYIKDDALWRRARELTGKAGLSAEIQGFVERLVQERESPQKGFKRTVLAVGIESGPNDFQVEHIAFNGRLIHKAIISGEKGARDVELAVFQTAAGKLVLTVRDPDEGPVIGHYAVYDSLGELARALKDDGHPEDERVAFLNSLAEALGQEWARWID